MVVILSAHVRIYDSDDGNSGLVVVSYYLFIVYVHIAHIPKFRADENGEDQFFRAYPFENQFIPSKLMSKKRRTSSSSAPSMTWTTIMW